MINNPHYVNNVRFLQEYQNCKNNTDMYNMINIIGYNHLNNEN